MANFDWLKMVRYYVFSVCVYVVFSLVKKLVTIVFRGVVCERTMHFHVCVFSLVKTIVLRGVMCGRTVFMCVCAYVVFSLVKKLVTIVFRGVVCERTMHFHCVHACVCVFIG